MCFSHRFFFPFPCTLEHEGGVSVCVCVCIWVFLTLYVVYVWRAGVWAVVCVHVVCPEMQIFVGIGKCIGLYTGIYWTFLAFFLPCVSSVGVCMRVCVELVLFVLAWMFYMYQCVWWFCLLVRCGFCVCYCFASSSSISLPRDRSIVPSKLSFSVFGVRLSRKSCNVVVFPFAFHITVQKPLKPLWSRLLLCDHEPSQTSLFCASCRFWCRCFWLSDYKWCRI
jgi:hypothetical protein